MNVKITARHFDLTDSIKVHCESAIESLEKYGLDIISVNAIITEEKHKKVEFEAEFTVNVAGCDTMVVKKIEPDAHAAIDKALESVQKTLRRYHDKLTNKHVEKPELVEEEV